MVESGADFTRCRKKPNTRCAYLTVSKIPLTLNTVYMQTNIMPANYITAVENCYVFFV